MELGRRLVEWRRLLFPRLSTRSILAHYLPMAGAMSHSFYAIHILSPNLLTRYFGVHDLAVEFSLLCTATLGPGFAMYFRPHMNRVGRWKRVEFCVFTAVMFTYGSLFTIVFIKDVLPTTLKVWMKSLIAVGVSWFLLSRGYQYLNFHDSRRKQRKLIINGMRTAPPEQHEEMK